MRFKAIFKKFRNSLPDFINDGLIAGIIGQCIERISQLDGDVNFLLEPEVKISYGEPVHFLDLGAEVTINVFSVDPFSITWVFDVSTGDLIAT